MMMVIVMTKKTVVVVVTTMLMTVTGMPLLMFTYVFCRVVPLLNATEDEYRITTYLCAPNFVGYGILAGSR